MTQFSLAHFVFIHIVILVRFVRRDVLALGIVITELLGESEDEESVRFREFARNSMLLPDSSRRPNLHTGRKPAPVFTGWHQFSCMETGNGIPLTGFTQRNSPRRVAMSGNRMRIILAVCVPHMEPNPALIVNT
jgi:hypothetical protein